MIVVVSPFAHLARLEDMALDEFLELVNNEAAW